MYNLLLGGFKKFFRKMYSIYSKGNNSWKGYLLNKGVVFDNFFRDLGLTKYIKQREAFKEFNAAVMPEVCFDANFP